MGMSTEEIESLLKLLAQAETRSREAQTVGIQP
jgi:hypothetical protein